MSTPKKRPPRKKRTETPTPQLSRLLTATFGDPERKTGEDLAGEVQTAIWAVKEAEHELRTRVDLEFVGLAWFDEQHEATERLTRLCYPNPAECGCDAQWPRMTMAYYLGLVAGFQFAPLAIGGGR